MRNLLQLLVAISLIFSTQLQAQCPVAGFSLPDTACTGSGIQIQNTSTGTNLRYEWDFNANDLSLSPATTPLGNFQGTLGSSLGFDVIKSGGNYYGFNMNLGGVLSRFEFGNSLSNIPAVTALGSIAGLGNAVDISVLEENGNFYALVNTLGGNIVRLEFGNSITNIPVAVTVNVNSALFNTAYYHTVYRTPSETFLLIANIGNNAITVINFGSSVTNNNPAAGNISVPGANPISITVGRECGDFYGFVGYGGNTNISRIDFGPAISATPLQVTNLTTAGIAYRDMNLINDGYNWILAAASLGGDLLQRYDFGPSLSNLSPAVSNFTGLSAFSSGTYAFCLKKFDSSIGGITTNFNSGELNSFGFPEANTGAPAPGSLASPTVTFQGSGYYYVHLTITDTVSGQSAYYRDSAYMAANPVSGFIYTALCSGDSTLFTNSATSSEGTITGYQWHFGNGDGSTNPNPVYTYPAAGTYAISLAVITNFGCADTIQQTAEVFTPPAAGFSFPNTPCMGAAILLTDTSTTGSGSINSWNWHFGNSDSSQVQQPQYAWSNNGNFTITLVAGASTGCKDTASAIITILPGPIVDFSAKNTCLGDTVKFLNQTNIPTSITAQYAWTFGDGGSSNLDQPNHTYPTNTAGDYIVTLIATGSNGCNDTLQDTIHIGLPASADFTLSADSICVLSDLTLNNTTILPVGETLLDKYWDFGNGTADTSSNTTQTSYNGPGTYNVQLTVETKTSCRSTLQKQIVVIDNPTASFSGANVCFGNAIQFSDQSTTPAGTQLTNWKWNFGDSTLSGLQNPTHQYAVADTFPVTLVVTHSLGCSDSLAINAITYQQPAANFITSKACTNQQVLFTDSTTVGDGSITQWKWDFGDGTPSDTAAQPTHSYGLSAAYPVTFIATSSNGCSDSITKLIVVFRSPEYTLTNTPVCAGKISTYQVSVAPPLPPSAGYLWNFGDSTASNQPLPSHFFAQPGSYLTSLTITDLGNGCATTKTVNSIVYNNPAAGFTVQPVCSGLPFLPSDTSKTADGTITSWNWNAGIYGTYNTPSIQFNSQAADTFPVKLVVTTNFGCKDSVTKSFITYPLPTVNFSSSVNYGAPPLPVTFTNNSTAGTYLWNFGDGSPLVNSLNATHTYADTGVYATSLVVTSPQGCVDSSKQNIFVLIPREDLGITAVSFTLTNTQWVMRTQIQNLGNTFAASAEIKLSLQFQYPVIEYYSDLNLDPGETKWITMGTRYPADERADPELFCAEILKVNDAPDLYTSNNRQCKSLDGGFTIYPLYPNPGNGQFYLPVNSNSEREISVLIYSITGQKLGEPLLLPVKKGFNTFEISLGDYAAGIYLLNIIAGEDEKNIRLIRY